MQIDMNSPVPLYYQLREQIRSNIINGTWKYGDELPSENKLCQQLGLSRATVKQAFDGLVNDGFIVRRQGRGTFVNYQKMSYDILKEPNFYAKKDQESSKQWALVLESQYVKCSKLIADKLHIKENDSVCYFKRVRYIDKIPMIIQTVYIRAEYTEGIFEQNFASLSFHRYIEEHNNIKLNFFQVGIDAVILNDYELELFCVKKSRAGFLFNTVYYNEDTPIVCNERLFRGDCVSLALDFHTDKSGREVQQTLNIQHNL